MKHGITFILVLIVLAGVGIGESIRGAETLRVGILPFSVFSSEKVDYLQDVIADRLGEDLARHDFITIVQPTLSPTEYERHKNLTREQLEALGKNLGVDLLVYGSLTKIENELSLDARVYPLVPDEATFRDFVVGSDFDRLVVRIENKIADHLRSVAARVSPGEEHIAAEEAEPEEPSLLAREPEKEAPPSPVFEEPALERVETAMVKPQEPKPAPAQAPKPEERKKGATAAPAVRMPFHITANRMVADNRERTVSFFGDVKATSEELAVISDKMTVVYSEQQDIDAITAWGNVKISQKDFSASCEMAKLLQADQKIILTGKPKVWQGNNMVRGETVTIFLDEDQVVVDGEKDQRVNVVIYPEQRE